MIKSKASSPKSKVSAAPVFGLALVVLGLFMAACRQQTSESVASAGEPKTNLLTFAVRGVVKKITPGGQSVVIEHEAISNYMPAMTMSFKARQRKELTDLRAGDEIFFRLSVGEDESWIDQITKTGRHGIPGTKSNVQPVGAALSASSTHPLLDYKFTNQLGQAVSLNEFKGQALAITFFFTRCPIPDFCPRLSKNFEEASRKLSAMPAGPTNWHFLSFSFDTEFDTPAVLQVYGERYHYDLKHWSFLTGPADKIAELARLSDVTFDQDGGFFNHNFRTLIIDTAGHMQMAFPISGNLSDAIAEEIRKAAAVTNAPVSRELDSSRPTALVAP